MSEFDSLTPFEFYTLIKDYNEMIFEDYKKEAELKRLFTMMLINTQIKRGHQYKDPTKFLPFHWEKSELNTEEILEISESDWEELDKKYIRK